MSSIDEYVRAIDGSWKHLEEETKQIEKISCCYAYISFSQLVMS